MDEEVKKDEPSSFAKASEDKLVELEKKCDEYLNNWKRERADFLNYKKEEMERMALLVNYAKEDMIFKILPILDSIYLLQKHTKVEGIDMIQKQIDEFLKKEGIEKIEAIDKPFDPNTMEAVDEISNSQYPIPNTVAEEVQRGYLMSGKVLRPARVKISK